MPGTPIKLIKSREDDTANGVYHPITQCKLTGALDANNNLTGLHMRISGQSILAAVNPAGLQNGRDPATFQGLNAGGTEGAIGYTIPNLLIDHAMRNTHIPPWFWRGVNNNQNAIYLECFMDELAHAAGQDPLEFRRKLMANHPKHLAVLNAVAEQGRLGKAGAAGRLPRPRPADGLWQLRRGGCRNLGDGREQDQDPPHRRRHRSAATRSTRLRSNGRSRARSCTGCPPCSTANAPSRMGRIEQTNFDTYNSMRISEMPKVESIVMPSGDFWGGVGEPTIFVAAPAVLNAFFAATGKRIRSVPLKNHDISFA